MSKSILHPVYKRTVMPALLSLSVGLLPAAVQTPIALSTPTRVNSYTQNDQQTPATACDPSGICVIVWDSVGEDGSLDGIYAQRYANGSPVGGEFRINSYTTNRQLAPDVAMDDSGDFVVSWASDDQDGIGLSIRARLYAANGTPIGASFQVNNTGTNVYPEARVAMDASGAFVVIWDEHSNQTVGGIQQTWIKVRRYAADGSAISAPQQIASGTLKRVRVPQIAMNNSGGFVAVWDADITGGWVGGLVNPATDIYLRCYNSSGYPTGLAQFVSPVTSDLLVDRPVITRTSNGGYVVAWEAYSSDLSPQGIYLRRYSSAGVEQGSAYQAGYPSELTHTPTLAPGSDGGFVMVAAGNGIWLQNYSASGAPTGAPQRVDTTSTGDTELLPAIALSNSQLMVTWQHWAGGSEGRDIEMRSYSTP